MLNLPGFQSTASMVAEIHGDTEYPENAWCVLHISDCDRKVSLNLTIDNGEEHFKNSLYKVDTMQRLLSELREEMINEHARLSHLGKERSLPTP